MIRYCPQCGLELSKVIPLELYHNGAKAIVYDCFCSNCGWSGEISPDATYCLEEDASPY